jgi:hypothetical protein
MMTFLFGLSHVKGNKYLNCTRPGNKYAHIKSIMTMSAKVRMLFLVNIMSIN